MLVYGIIPGPLLFDQHPDFVASIIASFFIANVILLVLNLPLVGLWAKLITVPTGILMSIVAACCLMGAYLTRNSFIDVWVAVIFGIVGWLLTEWKVPIAPLVMGFILGPLLEARSLQAFGLSPTFFIERPIFIAFMAAIAMSFIFGMRMRRKGMAGDEE
jgi:putative tricarboxylic transport membrane protein